MDEEWRYYEGVVELRFRTHGVWSTNSEKAYAKILDKVNETLELEKFVSYSDEDKDKRTMKVIWDYEDE